MFVTSADGTDVAVHELAGASDRPPLLISHATGFHGRCYGPMAAVLSDRFNSFALDHRGHGATAAPAGWLADWTRFGEDAMAVARSIAPDGGLVGFGHSMGGAALLMAADQDPTQFDRLVLFEPIAHPDPDERIDMEKLPIVRGARRRRRRFASIEDAIENYREKPPMSLMTTEVLRAYVEHGLRPTPDGDDVELCCDPAYEASVFVRSHSQRLFERLPRIAVPTLVISGRHEDRQPSMWAPMIARHLPRGELLVLDEQTHFGPFSHPAEIAALVADPVRST